MQVRTGLISILLILMGMVVTPQLITAQTFNNNPGLMQDTVKKKTNPRSINRNKQTPAATNDNMNSRNDINTNDKMLNRKNNNTNDRMRNPIKDNIDTLK